MFSLRCFSNLKLFRINFKQSYKVNNIAKMPFYAVAKGRTPGIFMTWADCESQVKGFTGARYKKFDSAASAQQFIEAEGGSTTSKKINKPNPNKYSYQNNRNNLKRPYSTSACSNGESSKQRRNEDFQDESDSDLDELLNQKMDDLEGKSRIPSQRRTQLIEPPHAKRSKSGFETDSEGYVHVYTDGACSANGRNSARAGLGVYWGDGHPLNKSQPVSGRATNNCGEIQAATQAIKQAVANGITKLVINTDSQFLINSVTKWMPGWKRKGWKLSSGAPVKNEVDFKDLDSVHKKIDIKWNYVEAHKGIHGNEMADQLAKAGAERYNK